MNTEKQSNRKRKAIIATVLFHICVFLLFLLPALKTPVPLPQEDVIEIAMADFGTDFTGSGDIEPEVVSESPSETPVTDNTISEPVANQSEVVATETSSEVSVPNSKKENKEPKKEERKANPLLNFTKKESSGTPGGGSEGSGSDAGNEGNENGNPAGRGVFGKDGGGWSLAGRGLVKKGSINTTEEEGKVVLNIFVDRNGNVVRSTVNLGLSTTASDYLFNLAKKAAQTTKFSSNPEAAFEQKGEITFIFKLK